MDDKVDKSNLCLYMLSIFSANESLISQINGSDFTAWYAEVLVVRNWVLRKNTQHTAFRWIRVYRRDIAAKTDKN